MNNALLHNSVLNSFASIDLEEMDTVSFMRRRDTKYAVRLSELEALLEIMPLYFRLLEIKNERLFHYKSEYFDTDDFRMYMEHHHKKLNRFKIRKRHYEITGNAFFEMKFKSNKSITTKKRCLVTDDDSCSEKLSEFTSRYTPFDYSRLDLKLINHFDRATFVDKDMSERITIDTSLAWESKDKIISVPDIAVVEIKNESKATKSLMYQLLLGARIHPGGFSKYMIGCALLYPDLKTNLLKRKLNKVHRLSIIQEEKLIHELSH